MLYPASLVPLRSIPQPALPEHGKRTAQARPWNGPRLYGAGRSSYGICGGYSARYQGLAMPIMALWVGIDVQYGMDTVALPVGELAVGVD